MIIDSETDKVYLSSGLKKLYPEETERILSILLEHHIPYEFLPTSNIWIRDYMPIQVDFNKYVKFVYAPPYLKSYEQREKINLKKILCFKEAKIIHSNLIIDGGDVVKSKSKIILSSRIFDKNKSKSKSTIISELEKIFQVEVIIIPQIKDDETGHADGLVRFIDEKTVLVNSLEKEYHYFRKGILKVFQKHNLDYMELPWFIDRTTKNSAVGVYINFLQMKDLIIFPVFDHILDEKALSCMHSYYKNYKICPISINKIGLEGGLMNCITWNIKEIEI
jgi:agmatine deiminase